MAWLGEEFEQKAEGALAPSCVKDFIEKKLFDRRRTCSPVSAWCSYMDTVSLWLMV